MRAIVYREGGGAEVLRLTERPLPEPGSGEVRVRVKVSGVNPTDWKVRSAGPQDRGERVPNQDGAGVIDAVGEGIDPARIGQRVWIWEAAWQRPNGTAQEYGVLPENQAVPLQGSNIGGCVSRPVDGGHLSASPLRPPKNAGTGAPAAGEGQWRARTCAAPLCA